MKKIEDYTVEEDIESILEKLNKKYINDLFI
jgi:hypothetical protein